MKWVWLGIKRIACKLVAPIVVPFLPDEARLCHHIFGVDDTQDFSWWNIAIRNSCHNYSNRTQVEFTSEGDEDMEVAGVKVRRRTSLDGKYKSYRRTWGKARKKGKKEIYLGWTMNDEPKMRLTFQFRLF